MLRALWAVLLLAGMTNNANAFTCLLEVNGRVFLDGSCRYEEDPDGSFRFFNDTNPMMFAYVNMNGDGTGQGYWPGPTGGTHAHDNLGPLTRNGACWENRSARVCAWR